MRTPPSTGSGLLATLSRNTLFFIRKLLWTFRRPQYIVLLGAPGAGKGTLAKQLAPVLRIRHLSTGDLFRAERANQTDLGLLVQEHLTNGTLVPDDLTLAIVKRQLMSWHLRGGAVLDGFPRTIAQGKMLDELLASWGVQVTRVVVIDVDEAALIERLSNRRVCSNKLCGTSFNLKFELPREAGICDVCKSALYQRPDDVPEVIAARLQTYREATRPLCDYYQDAGVLVFVKSTETTTRQEVFAKVTAALKGY